MTKRRAVIFDLDGTAIPNKPNGMPSLRLKAAIKTAQRTHKVCAATGRPIANAKPILNELNLRDPCVTAAGTQIIDPITGKILWQASIKTADVQAVLEICEPYHYEVLVNNELIGEGSAARARDIRHKVNVMYVMACALADAEVMLQKLENVPGITASGVLSWTQEGIDVHITDKEATKEHAVEKLLQLLDLKKDEVAGVGDADNDIHLFEAVGYKVAMGNATDKLKARADKVIPSVEQDGLAQYFEELVS